MLLMTLMTNFEFRSLLLITFHITFAAIAFVTSGISHPISLGFKMTITYNFFILSIKFILKLRDGI